MSYEAYKVAVTISLVEHVSAGLASLSRHFARTDMDAAKLQSRLNAISKMTLGGGLLAGAGVLGLKALHGPYEEAKKMLQAQANLETLNLSKKDNASAYAQAATNAHKVLGTTITDNIKQIHDLHTVFGDMHHAIETSPMYAKYSANVASQTGKSSERLVMDTAKALEHRGGQIVSNVKAHEAELNMINQVTLATKNMVNGSTYLAASKTGKMAYQLMDKEYLYGNFAGLMSINGGDRSGTEAMTAFSSLIGGHMDGKAKNFMSELGLYEEGYGKKRLKTMKDALAGLSPEEKQLAIASMGGQTVVSGGLKDQYVDQFVKRPDLFVEQVLAPAIRQRFGMNLSDQEVALLVAKNFNRATGNSLGTQVTMASKLAKDTNIIKNTDGLDAANERFQKTAVGNEKALHAAWVNLQAAFGVTILPTIVKGMTMLTKVLQGMGDFFTRHPTFTGMLGHIVMALSAMAVLGGGLMLFKAAMMGLSLLNIAGVAGALGGGAGLAGAMGLLLTPAGLAVAAIVAVTAAFWGISKLMALRDGSVAATTAGTLQRDKAALAGLNTRLANAGGLSELQRKGLLSQRTQLEKQISAHADSVANKSSRYGSMLNSDAGAGRGKSYAQPGVNGGTTVTANTYLDGKLIAKEVTTHQAREAQRGIHNSSSGYDPLRGTPSPAMR